MAERAELVLSAQDKTSGAFQSAKRNLAALKGEAESFTRTVGSLGALPAAVTGVVGAFAGLSAVRAGFELLDPRPIIDAADGLNKLTQRTGIAVETLGGYQHAAKLADVSNEDLSVGLRKLNLNIAAAARGETEQAAAFEAIGVSVKDAAGNIRSEQQIFEDLADKFAGYEDGPNKAALANAFFGKSFETLIPLLNGGRKGLQDARAELDQFGATIGADLAAKSERFNDNLTKLGVALDALKVSIAGGVIDQLVRYGDALVDAAKNQGLFAFSLERLQKLFTTVTPGRFGWLEDGLKPDKLGAAETAVASLADEIARLQGYLEKNPASNGIAEQLTKKTAEYDKARQALAALTGSAGDQQRETNRFAEGAAGAKAKVQAPPLRNASAAGASAAADPFAAQLSLLRRNLDARNAAIAQQLAREDNLLRDAGQISAATLRAGTTSLEANFAQQDELRRRHVEEVQRATDETIRVEQAYQASLPAPKDAAQRLRNEGEVQGSETRIEAARAKLADAQREFDQATRLDAIARPDDRERLAQQVAAFNAAIDDLVSGGAGRADELTQIAERTRDAQRLLVQAGVAPEAASIRAEDYGNLLRQAREANLLRDEYGRLTDRARTAEEALAVAQQASGPGLVEGERQLLALRTEQIRQLDAIIARTAELARQQPGNSTLTDELERLRVERAKLAQIADPTKLRLDSAAENIGNTIADGLERAAFEGGKLRDILRDIGTTVLREVSQELVTKPAAVAIGNIVKGAGGQGTGQNLIGQIGQLVGLLPAGQGTGTGQSSAASGQAGKAADATAQATENIAGLATAAAGSADVLGQLPAAAAIPATAALGSLAGAAQIAAAALAQIGGGATAKALDLSSLFDFGSGKAFGNLDLGQFFSDGGYTGNAGVAEAAGIVHGKEFVFSAPAVSRIGVGALDRLHESAKHGQSVRSALLPGYAAGGYVGSFVPSAAPIIAAATALPWSPEVAGTPDVAAAPAAPAILPTPGPGERAVVLQAGEVLVAPAARPALTSPQAPAVARAEASALQASAGLRGGLQAGIAIVPRPAQVVAPGLAPDEVPAVLPVGTEVLTAGDPRITLLMGGHTDVLAARNASAAVASFGIRLADDDRVPRGTQHAPAPSPYAGLERYHDGGIVGGSASRMGGLAAAYADAAAHYAPAAAAGDAPAPQRPINLVQNFHGPADRRTVQQAAVDGMRAAMASNARGNA